LANHFGNNSVYMDIDSVPFGIDFREHIKEAVIQNDVLVAVIGPNWSGQANNSRLIDETDPVRVEIETALKGGIPVVPVLVAGATMPKAAELPDGMKDLAFRNAATVDGGRDFHQHMDRLIRSMDKLLVDKQTVRKSSVNRDDPVTAQKGKKVPHLPGQLFLGVGAVLGVVAFFVLLVFGGLVVVFIIKGTAPHQQVNSVPQQQQPQQQPPQQLPPQQQPPQQQAQQQPPQQQVQPQPQQQAQPQPQHALQQPPQQFSATFPKVPPPCAKTSTGNSFYDNFKSHELGWLPPIGTIINSNEVSHYDNDHLVITPNEKTSLMLIYSAMIFSNINACLRIMSPPDQPKGLSSAGILFWFQDFANVYGAAMFFEPPSIQLYRNIDRSWLAMGTSSAYEISTEPSGINQIQILTKGELGAEYVNGKKVGEFKGQPPAKAPVGILAQSGPQQKLTWRFLEFSVSESQ
jgi:hypothetical protein